MHIDAKVLEVFDNHIKKPLGDEVSNMLNDSLVAQESRYEERLVKLERQIESLKMDIELAKKEKQIMQVNLELAVDTMCKSVEKSVGTQMGKLVNQLDEISNYTHKLDSKIKFQREIEESMNELHASFTKSLKDLESQVVSTND